MRKIIWYLLGVIVILLLVYGLFAYNNCNDLLPENIQPNALTPLEPTTLNPLLLSPIEMELPLEGERPITVVFYNNLNYSGPFLFDVECLNLSLELLADELFVERGEVKQFSAMIKNTGSDPIKDICTLHLTPEEKQYSVQFIASAVEDWELPAKQRSCWLFGLV